MKIIVLKKKFSKLTERHLYESLLIIKFQKLPAFFVSIHITNQAFLT